MKGQYLNAGDIKFDNIQEIPVNMVRYHTWHNTVYHTEYHTVIIIFRLFSVNIKVSTRMKIPMLEFSLLMGKVECCYGMYMYTCIKGTYVYMWC